VADHPLVGRFRSWLREHELPVTAQRLAVAEIVLASDRHLSAEDVTAELAARGMKAGTATVYRTLDVLVASGLVIERDFAEGSRRFEPAHEGERPAQLLCTSCGRVEEFRDDRLELLTAAAAESHGFLRERHRLVVYGVCHECREPANAQPGAALAHST
jgi:Fur family transcriptional regulator, ferric uptake regulator